MQYAIMALALVYGAYVAEVYRAGIESIHPSQTAAARSLGLTYAQTMRHVVVPQAVRRVVPPLLNDFIGLQKDTALIFPSASSRCCHRARFVNNSEATFTGYTMAAMLFFLITIPMTRFVDRLQRRTRLACEPADPAWLTWSSTTSTSTSAATRCCGGSTSTSIRTRSCASSAPRAAASRPCCGASTRWRTSTRG